jgi:tetratricopeptide (TPR) repeat protein
MPDNSLYEHAKNEVKQDMDLDNPVIQLCIKGTEAEFKGQLDTAHAFYFQAWEIAHDDFDACIAAHYVARHQQDLQQKLHWNQTALDRANSVADDRVQTFYPSLYLNMGHSFEQLGNWIEAERYYALAAERGISHQPL